MERVANIIINLAFRNNNKIYSYLIPKHLEHIDLGWRVLVNFSNRKTEGFVIGFEDNSAMPCNDLKPIIDVLDEHAWFDAQMLATARWIHEYYLCSLVEALRLFIPGKTTVTSEKLYRISDNINGQQLAALLETDKSGIMNELLNYIQAKQTVKLAQLENRFGPKAKGILNLLRQAKIILYDSITHKKGEPKYENKIYLAVNREIAAAFEQNLRGRPAQRRLLAALLDKQVLSGEELRKIKITNDTVKKLTDTGMIKSVRNQVFRDPYHQYTLKQSNLTLNSAQQAALSAIKPGIAAGQYQSFLLHGVTGSGKTEVYLEAVAEVRKLNRQAIVLVPEIALTSQTVKRFKARFGDDVVVLHSRLSLGERYDSLKRLQELDAGIIIGARSAVFAPVKNLGIIIIDEEHEFTYKQEETPRYHTRKVAWKRAQLARAILIMGSATPTVETYYEALRGEHLLITMAARIDGSSLPEVKLVDMRAELAQGRRSVISTTLQQLLAATLENNEQAIILLNRRGYATFVLCRECGFVMRCDHCDASLVYHLRENILRCHYCQGIHEVPHICPSCGSRYIRYFGTGTQKVEEELNNLFPQARILRMDQDTTGTKTAHAQILESFASGKFDILLGTQMVAKGHDFKNVTAVGIIAADTALNLPDFRAAERTFALLTQAAGRAGRGEKRGQVVVQTYNPEHYAVKCGTEQDYQTFYKEEIKYRRGLMYPPFSHIIKLTVCNSSEEKTRHKADKIVLTLNNELTPGDTQIMGPFPALIAKINNIYRCNIIIKTLNYSQVKDKLMEIANDPEIIIDNDPISVV